MVMLGVSLRRVHTEPQYLYFEGPNGVHCFWGVRGYYQMHGIGYYLDVGAEGPCGASDAFSSTRSRTRSLQGYAW